MSISLHIDLSNTQFRFRFIGLSSTLPRTSYLRMVDIWMIFGMVAPFCDIILFVMEGLYKQKENTGSKEKNLKC